MAELETVTFGGQSGRQYEFRTYTLDTTFRSVGAVYGMLHRYWKQDEGRYYFVPLYFGQTGDLTARFEGHHRQRCFDQNGANCIGVHVDADERSRFAKETDLIRKWDPTCNRQ